MYYAPNTNLPFLGLAALRTCTLFSALSALRSSAITRKCCSHQSSTKFLALLVTLDSHLPFSHEPHGFSSHLSRGLSWGSLACSFPELSSFLRSLQFSVFPWLPPGFLPCFPGNSSLFSRFWDSPVVFVFLLWKSKYACPSLPVYPRCFPKT